MLDIVHAQQYISEWQFLQAILAIQASDNKLQLWNGVVPLKVRAQCDMNFHLYDASRRVHVGVHVGVHRLVQQQTIMYTKVM